MESRSQFVSTSFGTFKKINHYKFGSNRVEVKDADGNIVGVLFNPTLPHLVAKEMNELVDWTILEWNKREIHPLIIIGNFIFEFLSIHPFQDGNGRVSRILTNLLLLKSGYEYMPYVSHEKLIESLELYPRTRIGNTT